MRRPSAERLLNAPSLVLDALRRLASSQMQITHLLTLILSKIILLVLCKQFVRDKTWAGVPNPQGLPHKLLTSFTFVLLLFCPPDFFLIDLINWWRLAEKNRPHRLMKTRKTPPLTVVLPYRGWEAYVPLRTLELCLPLVGESLKGRGQTKGTT